MTSIKIDKKEEEEDGTPQIDFFADMVPEFKQPAQIRIRCNDGTPPPSANNRLGVDANFNVSTVHFLRKPYIHYESQIFK